MMSEYLSLYVDRMDIILIALRKKQTDIDNTQREGRTSY